MEYGFFQEADKQKLEDEGNVKDLDVWKAMQPKTEKETLIHDFLAQSLAELWIPPYKCAYYLYPLVSIF